MLLEPLADWLGVELIGTELQKETGRWLPALAGANCKGPGKVARLSAHLGPLALGDQVIEAFGNSRGDRELLQFAAIPHYRSFGAKPRPYRAFSLVSLVPVLALSLLAYGQAGIQSQGEMLVPVLKALSGVLDSGPLHPA